VSTTVAQVLKRPRPDASFGSRISEYCMALLHQLGLGGKHSPNSIRAFGLMSCTSGEGVTTIAAPLAANAARHLQLRTVLVDCNLTHPTVHRTFGVASNPGLHSALADPTRLSEFIRPTAVENLSVLAAGDLKRGAIPDCGSPNLSHVLGELRDAFDLTIVDAPPFGHGASSGIGSLLDGIVLVVAAERTRSDAVQRMASSLRGAGVNLLGVVMNKRREHVSWLSKTV
jgi:capsular exopolysaccharide synthesis family protein